MTQNNTSAVDLSFKCTVFRELRLVNLVKSRKIGKKVYYTIKDEQLKVFLKCSFNYVDSHE